MRFYLDSLGCKLNQAEIETLARQALTRGHRVVQDPATADWAIINTCTVTHVAARKSRQMIRRLHRQNPELRLAIVGCYAETSPAMVEALAGVDLVLGTRYKEDVLDRILELTPTNGDDEPLIVGGGLPQPLPGGHTRAFLKIQEGCDNRCTYCIVTIARGPARSRPPDEILQEATERADEGYQEIVLTGINIGAYGRDLQRDGAAPSLAGLARVLLAETDMGRLRLSSIEPWDVTPELIELFREPRVCRHAHLPLQSGCDATLRRMGRNYTGDEFTEIAGMVRHRVPDIALTTDVMVGFPGETENEFRQSVALIERIGFSRLHVFQYSPRPGTVAAGMADQVDPQVARARSDELIALGGRMAHTFHRRFLGHCVEVLFETRDDTDEWSGWTDHYIRVRAPADRGAPWGSDLHNQLATVRTIEATADGLRGEIAQVR